MQAACLISPHDGGPAGLGGLVAHLFWTEPSQLMLARFLSAGVFHQVRSAAALYGAGCLGGGGTGEGGQLAGS